MCQFFSFVTYKGKPFYLNIEKRKEIISRGKEYFEFLDSHSFLCSELKLDVDKVNKYEYNDNGFEVDQINDLLNDSEEAKKWVEKFIKTKEFQKICIESVVSDGKAIKYIKNPSEKLKEIAVKQNGNAIKYIKNPSEKLKELAVKQNKNAIKHIKNPSTKIQELAVKQNGYVIKYIKNPSEKIQELAVKQNGYVIKHIKNPSEKLKELAVKENGYAMQYIKNPSEKIQELAVKRKWICN